MNRLLKIETELKAKYRIHYFNQLSKEDWFRISSYCMLPEGFIAKYKEFVDWKSISYKQNLSENFIRYYKNSVDWYGISSSQTLSLNFIEEFRNVLHFKSIYKNPQISDDTKKKLP